MLTRLLTLLFISGILFFLSIHQTYALNAEDHLKPEYERRAKSVFLQLRCMVCDGESIADSNAELAANMRHIIRNKIQQGQSDTEILTYFTERYGTVILMKPPITTKTSLLWFGPLILFVISLYLAMRYISKQQSKTRK